MHPACFITSSAEELLSGVSRATSIPITVISGRSRAAKAYQARALLCYLAVTLGGQPARRVADLLGRDPANVSRAVNWVEGLGLAERERLLQKVLGVM